jgi:hypothetical protein
VAIPGVSHTVLRRTPSRARRRVPDGYCRTEPTSGPEPAANQRFTSPLYFIKRP